MAHARNNVGHNLVSIVVGSACVSYARRREMRLLSMICGTASLAAAGRSGSYANNGQANLRGPGAISEHQLGRVRRPWQTMHLPQFE